MKFLKNFALGLLTAVLLPLLFAGLLVFAVYGLILYLVEACFGLVRFFSGRPFFKKLREDELVEKIKKREIEELTGEEKETPAPVPEKEPAPQNVYVQQNFYQAPPGGAYPPPPMMGQSAGDPLPIPPYQRAVEPSTLLAPPLEAEGQTEEGENQEEDEG